MAEKKKRRFLNAFDIAILLLIAIAVFILFKLGVFGSQTKVANDTIQEVTYVLKIAPIRFGTEENISVGDELFETVRKTSVGTITDIEVEDLPYYALNGDTGEYVESYVEGEKQVYLTIKAQCVVTKKEISAVDGQLIRCGESFNVNGPGYFGLGVVVDIERGDEN